MRRARVALAAPAACAVLLTGCTASDQPDPTPTTATTDAADAPALPEGVTPATSVPTEVPNDPAARRNVSVADCATADGGWRAAGSASNDTADAVTYELTVFFTTATATVLGVGETEVSVQPGATAEWTVEAAFTAPAGTRCVLAGVAVR